MLQFEELIFQMCSFAVFCTALNLMFDYWNVLDPRDEIPGRPLITNCMISLYR
jgi:hypothetical protein